MFFLEIQFKNTFLNITNKQREYFRIVGNYLEHKQYEDLYL